MYMQFYSLMLFEKKIHAIIDGHLLDLKMVLVIGIRRLFYQFIFCYSCKDILVLSSLVLFVRYTKALDVIKKTITSKQGDLREEETKKKYLKGHSETATEKLRELEVLLTITILGNWVNYFAWNKWLLTFWLELGLC